MKSKSSEGKKEIKIEPQDYSFTDYPVEEICEWLYKLGVVDSHNQMQKLGKLIIKWKEL